MTIELRMLNDDHITVGELKKFLSTIPNDYAIHSTKIGMYVKSLEIKTDKKNSWCTITLE